MPSAQPLQQVTKSAMFLTQDHQKSIIHTLSQASNSSVSLGQDNEKPPPSFQVDINVVEISRDSTPENTSSIASSLTPEVENLVLDNESKEKPLDTIEASLKSSLGEPTVSVPSQGPTEVLHTCSSILDIIFDYALNKFDDTKDRLASGVPKFLSDIKLFVEQGTQLQLCLPAFPFKSANKVYKVLGPLPDKAEELALDRLNSMCSRIGDIYGPGAKLTIISDGLVYNDLLCISDRDTWAYGEALRAMALRKNFNHLGFSRLQDLVKFPLPDKLQEITYVANATNFRRHLMNIYGKSDIDIDKEIETKPDTLMTYRGYRRFLESDLQHMFVKRSSIGYKKDVKYLAKEMLIRGYAFAEAVKVNFPNHLRLSIHQSTGEHKISMSLLNTKSGFTTPWHCSVALMADGDWISAPMGEFQKDPMLEVVHEENRPSYFQETIRKRPYLTEFKSS